MRVDGMYSNLKNFVSQLSCCSLGSFLILDHLQFCLAIQKSQMIGYMCHFHPDYYLVEFLTFRPGFLVYLILIALPVCRNCVSIRHSSVLV